MKKSSRVLWVSLILCMIGGLTLSTRIVREEPTVLKSIKAIKKASKVDTRPFALRNVTVPNLKINGLTATTSIAYDTVTNRYLYGDQPDKKMYNASTTKLMVLYLALKYLQTHPHEWSAKVTINGSVAKMSRSYYAGELPMVNGEKLTVRQLFDNALVASSNESITALGIWLAGSNRLMIEQMNQQAVKWHLKQTKYYSVSGLDNVDLVPFGLNILKAKSTKKNTSSARDLVVLADQLITQYPVILKHAQLKNTTTKGFTLPTTNRMLKGEVYGNPKFGVDGLKTGTTPAAGEVFVATAQAKNHHRVITVVMHSTNRFVDTSKILAKIYPLTQDKDV